MRIAPSPQATTKPSLALALKTVPGWDGIVSFLGSAASRIIRRFPLYKKGDGLRQPVHAQDVAVAILKSITAAESVGKNYEIGGGSSLSYRALVEQIFQALDLPPKFISIPKMPTLLNALSNIYQIKNLHGEVALRMNSDLLCDNNAAAADFGYNPRPFTLTSDML